MSQSKRKTSRRPASRVPTAWWEETVSSSGRFHWEACPPRVGGLRQEKGSGRLPSALWGENDSGAALAERLGRNGAGLSLLAWCWHELGTRASIDGPEESPQGSCQAGKCYRPQGCGPFWWPHPSDHPDSSAGFLQWPLSGPLGPSFLQSALCTQPECWLPPPRSSHSVALTCLPTE